MGDLLRDHTVFKTIQWRVHFSFHLSRSLKQNCPFQHILVSTLRCDNFFLVLPWWAKPVQSWTTESLHRHMLLSFNLKQIICRYTGSSVTLRDLLVRSSLFFTSRDHLRTVLDVVDAHVVCYREQKPVTLPTGLLWSHRRHVLFDRFTAHVLLLLLLSEFNTHQWDKYHSFNMKPNWSRFKLKWLRVTVFPKVEILFTFRSLASQFLLSCKLPCDINWLLFFSDK